MVVPVHRFSMSNVLVLLLIQSSCLITGLDPSHQSIFVDLSPDNPFRGGPFVAPVGQNKARLGLLCTLIQQLGPLIHSSFFQSNFLA